MELSISGRQYSFFIILSHSCSVFHCLQGAYNHINYLFAANSNSVRQAHRARHIIPLPQRRVLLTLGPELLSPKEMTGSLRLFSDKLFAVVVTSWRRKIGEHGTQERTPEQVGAGGHQLAGILHKAGTVELGGGSSVALGEKQSRNWERSPCKIDQGPSDGSHCPRKTVFTLSGHSVAPWKKSPFYLNCNRIERREIDRKGKSTPVSSPFIQVPVWVSPLLTSYVLLAQPLNVMGLIFLIVSCWWLSSVIYIIPLATKSVSHEDFWLVIWTILKHFSLGLITIHGSLFLFLPFYTVTAQSAL